MKSLLEDETLVAAMTRRSIVVQQHHPGSRRGSVRQGMRGKMSTNCLWHACKALFIGLILFAIGAIMSTLGFQADGLLDKNSNMTETRRQVYGEQRSTIKFSKLSYAGPIVMGIGGFIIVATCVMTFEARDSAAKVGPAAYTGARSLSIVQPISVFNRRRTVETRTIAIQTTGDSLSSNSPSPMHIFDKRNLLETFRKFSRTIRNTSTSTDEQFHRSPSAPSLLDLDGRTEATAAASTSAPKFRRASAVPKLKSRAQPLKNIQRAVSVDCPSSPSKYRNVPETAKLPSGILTTSKLSTSPSKRSEMGPKARRAVSYRTSVGQSTSCSAEIEESYLEDVEEPCSSQHRQNNETQTTDKKSSSVQFRAHNPVVHFQSATVELHSQNERETKHLQTTQSWDRNLESRGRPVSAGSHRHFESMAARPDASSVIIPAFAKTRFRSESTGRPVLMRQTHIEHTEITFTSNPDVEAIAEENT